MTSIDIVIPTFNRPKRVWITVESLLGQSRKPSNVLIIDQTHPSSAPPANVVKAFEKNGIGLRWRTRSDANLCGARNDAIEVSQADLCLFIDDDVLVPRDLLEKHERKYMENPKLTAVGGQVWHRRDDFDLGALSITRPRNGTVRASNFEGVLESGPLFGCHFSIRRSTAWEIGGWDEAFVGSANWEEGDLVHRLKAAGFQFVFDGSIWLIHIREKQGGCRIAGNSAFPEWSKSANFFLYGFRYPGEKSWLEVIRSAVRAGPLRREVVVSPPNWIPAVVGLFRGMYEGRKRAGRAEYRESFWL